MKNKREKLSGESKELLDRGFEDVILKRVVVADEDCVTVDGEPRIDITPEERTVLKKVLERETTAKVAHGGLKGLLSLNDSDTGILLGFLKRI